MFRFVPTTVGRVPLVRELTKGYAHGAVTILYFGDFDPSGEDMARSLGERLGFFET